MNCLQDTCTDGRNLLTDGAAVEVPKTIQRIPKDEERENFNDPDPITSKKGYPPAKKTNSNLKREHPYSTK